VMRPKLCSGSGFMCLRSWLLLDYQGRYHIQDHIYSVNQSRASKLSIIIM
jgi:hypothetical protein